MKKLALFLCFCVALSLVSAAFGVEAKQNTIKIGENVVVMPGGEVKTAIAIGGSVTVNGRVKEDVVAVGGNVSLSDTALVGGNVVAVGGKVDKAAGAIVKGEITEVSFPAGMSIGGILQKPAIVKGLGVLSALSFIGLLVLVIILVALFTPQLGLVSSAIEKRMGQSFLCGLLVIILFVPVIILLAVSIIGIILIPVWIMLVAAAALFGCVAASHFVGKKILSAFRIRGRSMMLETLTGVIILALVALLPVVGVLVKAIICTCGLGAAALTRCGTAK